ncbi:hypothetical protein D0C36_15830 [Mucilaginibacter conchicola]|uniref:Uncharacterized protein n=1 Tax=Mucilaginibacter conchicola TaxID=2303333 RepID=A0A372NUC5_9SPHI|nr:hypothetical protein D0C36_15830 [Mucilaginibacter conchicola]
MSKKVKGLINALPAAGDPANLKQTLQRLLPCSFFWEVELYLRKRLAASQTGSLPPQVSFLLRSSCALPPTAGGDLC